MSKQTLQDLDDAIRAHNADVNVEAGNDANYDHVMHWAIAYEVSRIDDMSDDAPVSYGNNYVVSSGTSPNTAAGVLSWAVASVMEDGEDD
jgi:hypothetical protein